MFHIFRWRRERKSNNKEATTDPFVSTRHKKRHGRRQRSRRSDESQTHQNLSQENRLPSPFDSYKHQVVMN